MSGQRYSPVCETGLVICQLNADVISSSDHFYISR